MAERLEPRKNEPVQTPADVPFETTNPNDYRWTDEAYSRLVSGQLKAEVSTNEGVKSVSVDGACPHCDHDVAFSQVLDAVAGEHLGFLGPDASAPDTSYVAVTVSCRCQASHPGRPAGVDRGCGVNFQVEVLAQP